MVKFIAKQAIDMTLLPGVEYLFDPETSYFYDRGSSSFRAAENAERDGYLLRVEGKDFVSRFSQPTSKGTVEELQVTLDKKVVYMVTGLDLKLSKIFDTSLDKAFNALFKGNDNFQGSKGIDVLVAGRGKDSLKGNGGNDTLRGEGGRDRLDGGDGVNTLDGGKGLDTYVFKQAPTSDRFDYISKFQKGETLEFAEKAFPALVGFTADNFLEIGSRPADGDDTIQYNPANGAVIYDADGSGSTGGITVAYLQVGAKLTADDIVVA